jgi:hypothetical protein
MSAFSNQNSANLKGKLVVLEQMINQLNEELNFHKKEVQILRSEKDTLESVLTMKTQEVRKTLTNELFRVEEEMKRHFSLQKAGTLIPRKFKAPAANYCPEGRKDCSPTATIRPPEKNIRARIASRAGRSIITKIAKTIIYIAYNYK